MFFQKFTKWLIDTLKRLFRPEKKFCFYDHSNVVIVDLPTIVSQKCFFSKIHQMTYWYPKTLILAPKNFFNYGCPTIVIVDFPTIVS